MSQILIPATIPTIPGLQAALDAKPQAANSALTGSVTIAGGTITDPAKVLEVTQTWNDAADTFTAINVNVTDSASAAASLLADFQVGGTSKFSVRKDGKVTTPHYVQSFGVVTGYLNDPTNAISHLNLTDAANLLLGSTLFQFGGRTAAYPALGRSGPQLVARLADDSGYADFRGKLQLETAAPPVAATDAGNAGQVRWDADYLYVCTAANTWKRAALATW